MNGKIQRAVKIGILLIILAFIATPVAAANTNMAYNMNTVINHGYKYFLPADLSTEYRNPLLHYTPSTDLSTFNPVTPVSSIGIGSINPFYRPPTIRWRACS
jgi:galactitol-specific phosphotransferase system IIC component